MTYLNKVVQGDSAILIKELPNSCIDLTVISPPYDKIRDYEKYVFDFKTIAKELYRVTKDGGVVVWVVGDSTKDGNESNTSFKQALFFKEIGFKLHDTMIYQKKRGLRFGSLKAYNQNFEYMFIFVKGKIKTVNLIRDKKIKYTQINSTNTTRKKDGSKHHLPNKELPEYAVRGNIWAYNTGTPHSTNDVFAFEHPAIFPEKLAKDHILSWSNKGDLVFDPFAGSGTTLKIARSLNRNYLGFEISNKYIKIIEKRLAQQTLGEGGEGMTLKNKYLTVVGNFLQTLDELLEDIELSEQSENGKLFSKISNGSEAIEELYEELENLIEKEARCPACGEVIRHLFDSKTGKGDGGECACTRKKVKEARG